MEKNKPAAERVRSILAAMERSIDTAREKRLQQVSGVRPTPASLPRDDQRTLGEPASTAPNGTSTTHGGDSGSTRLKARPKRSPAYGGPDGYRARSN